MGRHRSHTILAVVTAFWLASLTTAPAAAKDKWYEGGTLHKAGALDWQRASYRDKLATCADFIAAAWEKGLLKRKVRRNILSTNDIKPYARELVAFIDAALEREHDPAKNRRMYANLTVAETAAIGLIIMEWVDL